MSERLAQPDAGASRRDFIQMAAAGGVVAAGLLPATALSAPTTPGWEWGPMRWAHIVFTEDDPGRYDLRMWLDFFKRAHIGGAVLSGGGVAAFYPTKVPFHPRAAGLGDGDMFGEMSKACREELGMRILARVDPHALSREAATANPTWVMRAADGSPRRHPADPERILSCGNGPVTFEWMPKVLTEIVATYRVDGIFGNRWGGSAGAAMGVCHCEVCRAKFRAASGQEIPATLDLYNADASDPTVQAYFKWEEEVRFEQLKLWNDTVRAANPEAFFVPGTTGALNPTRLRNTVRAAFSDRQGRGPQGQSYAFGWSAKEVRSSLHDRPLIGIFSVGQTITPYRLMDSTISPAEIRNYVHDGMAHGFRPSVCKFKAETFDKRWMPAVEKAFAWHAQHERYFRNTRNLARVALVQSAQTRTYYDNAISSTVPFDIAGGRRRYEDAVNGWYQALVEARVPFEIVDDREMEPEFVDRYRVLILPNVAALSEKQCRQLRRYVASGGRIVATGETSLYDEWGRKRADFGLGDLFGCAYAGRTDEGVKNSYLTIRGPHPLLRGLEDTPRIINGTKIVRVTPHDRSKSPLTLVEPYPDLPMERLYSHHWESDTPMAYARTVGRGRVVYFPMDLDRTFWELSSEDHLRLMRNAVDWAADEPQPLIVTGSGLMDVAYWRQEGSVAAHLVNLTNPMAMRGVIREAFPVGPFEVSLQLPAGRRAAAVNMLEAGQAGRWRQAGERLIVEVPRIEVHEVVAVDLA